MEKQEKGPVLTKHLIDKCMSEEATREILRVEIAYKVEKEKLEQDLSKRNANLFMAKGARIVTPEFEKHEIEIQKEMSRKLDDRYLFKAEEIYEKYHPKTPEEKQAEFRESADEKLYAKGYNAGHLMRTYEAPVYSKTISGIRNVESPSLEIKGIRDSGTDARHMEIMAELKASDKNITRSTEKSPEIEKNRDFDKERNRDINRDI